MKSSKSRVRRRWWWASLSGKDKKKKKYWFPGGRRTNGREGEQAEPLPPERGHEEYHLCTSSAAPVMTSPNVCAHSPAQCAGLHMSTDSFRCWRVSPESFRVLGSLSKLCPLFLLLSVALSLRPSVWSDFYTYKRVLGKHKLNLSLPIHILCCSCVAVTDKQNTEKWEKQLFVFSHNCHRMPRARSAILLRLWVGPVSSKLWVRLLKSPATALARYAALLVQGRQPT